jgi:hypothetical protein
MVFITMLESILTNRPLAGIKTSSGLKIPKDAKDGSYIIGSFGSDLEDLIKYETKYANVSKSDNFPLPNNQKFNMLNVDDATYKYWSKPENGGFFKNVNGPWVDSAVYKKADNYVASDVKKYLYSKDIVTLNGVDTKPLTGFGKEIHRLEYKHGYRYDPTSNMMVPPNKSQRLKPLTKEKDYVIE